MKAFDRYLQNVRINKAKKYISRGAHVLDIGCSTGELFTTLSKVKSGVGVDPYVDETLKIENVRFVRSEFSEDISLGEKFDAITMLAVIEHIPVKKINEIIPKLVDLLQREGKLIMTIPDSKVDYILRILKSLRIIDGMEIQEHYGFDVNQTIPLFTATGQLQLLVHKKFQLGLNNLFVFEKMND